MPFEVMRISAFMYQQRYVEFLLEHYSELNLPYPFHISLGYISSPVLLNQEQFLALDDDNEVIGTISLIRGTAEHDYANREIVQIQTAYITRPYQSSTVFISLLQIMTQCLIYQEEPITDIVFWTGKDAYMEKLITRRFDVSPVQHHTIYGQLTEYRIPFNLLKQYSLQFRQPRYF